jgi:hypothetical protein
MTCKSAAFFKLPLRGRHAGKTLLAVDLAGGRKYLEWIATEWHGDEVVAARRAARAYLRWFPVTPGPRRMAEAGAGRYNRCEVEVNVV